MIRSALPVDRIIVENSRPLGLARMKAIQAVQTDWFAFIDDDVELPIDWFLTLKPYLNGDDVGAVEGGLSFKGLSNKLDQLLPEYVMPKTELKLGERGWTCNTLIRTHLVRDWKPSSLNLSAWEDYDLTQHILRKGYRWIRVPVIGGYHYVSWRKLARNSIWSARGGVRFKSPRTLAKSYVGSAFWHLKNPDLPIEVKAFNLYMYGFCLMGVLKEWLRLTLVAG